MPIVRSILLLSSALPATAEEFSLSIPLDCKLGESCYIQNYVDHDPTPGIRDFACGTSTYDGHKGTDFALNDLSSLSQNIAVLATSAGVVVGTRNTMPDIAINAPNAPDLNGKDCGNGVTISHESGYETQYCHMKQGSVSVQSGDIVDVGTPLGVVGLSGRTEFPHLHFEVRQAGAPIDPFLPNASVSCGLQSSLWTTDLKAAQSGIISSGVATFVPEYAQILEGLTPTSTIQSMPPALVAWAFLHNARKNDEVHFEISSGERIILSEKIALDKNQARVYRAVGKRAPTDEKKWGTGQFFTHVTVLRDGQLLDQRTSSFTIEP